jgi:OTU domain-containing protein 6
MQVVQAEGPDVIVGADVYLDCAPLLLSYHRHAYGLGEHYNSTRPAH